MDNEGAKETEATITAQARHPAVRKDMSLVLFPEAPLCHRVVNPTVRPA